MTQEEKAKAYDEALKRARKIHSEIVNNELLGFPGQIEDIFPQLRESEDERIRKGLIEALKASKTVGELKFVLPEPTREECIAYLEKQKDNQYFVGYAKGYSDGQLNPKQKEQKHPDGCFTCDEYKKGYEEGRRNGFTAGYNKAMKEVEQKEQMLKDTDYNKLDKEIATWIPAHISGGDDEVWRDIKKAVTEWAGIVARHFYEFGRGIK